jgi:hypothetical protein
MKARILTFLMLALTLSALTQIAPNKYFVSFTDKNNSPYSIDNPSEFLTQRAIERRLNQNIAIDLTDIPVNPNYIQGVAGTGASVLTHSKWMNGVTIFTDNPSVLDAVNALPYVAGVTMLAKPGPSCPALTEGKQKPFFANETFEPAMVSSLKEGNDIGVFNYGASLNQIQMLNGDIMHEMGYRGQGKVIAVIDAGFYNVNNLDVFDSLWANNQILGTHDFVDGGLITFDGHTHGAMVLSLIGGNYPGYLIGTAPKASFWLLRSEDANTEYLVEEYNWVSAAEYADSVGADVINSSLGYTEFDDPSQNHVYADMDGNTCIASKGADMLAKKGVLVVNSLGNSGSDPWYYLGAPSDGDSVLGIGAVDAGGYYASFSSHGPSYDGRVKPDVTAQGSGVFVVDPYSGGFGYGSGTSFSSPITAGMATCLWQANPLLNNMQIADAIRKSASQFNNPDDMLGYGIPDFILANNILTVIDGPADAVPSVNVYPNPFTDVFTVANVQEGHTGTVISNGTVEISDITGRIVATQKINTSSSGIITIDQLRNAPKGIYIVKVSQDGSQFVQKIVKE